MNVPCDEFKRRHSFWIAYSRSIVFLSVILIDLFAPSFAFAMKWRAAAHGIHYFNNACVAALANHAASYPHKGGYVCPVEGKAFNYSKRTGAYAYPAYSQPVCESGEISVRGHCVARFPNDPAAACEGNPIDVLSGRKIERVEDFSLYGNPEFGIARTYVGGGEYNSFVEYMGILGDKWRFDFESRYLVLEGSTYIFELPDRRVIAFKQDGLGNWIRAYLKGRDFAPMSAFAPRRVAQAKKDEPTLPPTEETLTNDANGYYLSLRDGTKITYGLPSKTKIGLPNQIEYANGLTLSIERGFSRRVESITDQSGRKFIFNYNELSGRFVSSISFQGKEVVRYQYRSIVDIEQWKGIFGEPPTPDIAAAAVMLVRVQRGSGDPGINYVYEDSRDPTLLTGVIDEENVRFATFTYGLDRRAETSEHADGSDSVAVTYDSDAKRATVTNALGKTKTISYRDTPYGHRVQTTVDGQASTNCPASSTSYSYSDYGLRLAEVDPEGRRTEYVRNDVGLPTSVTEGAGTPGARTTSYVWDLASRKPLKKYRPGLTTDYVWSGPLLASLTETDTTAHSSPYPTAGQTRTWTFGYTPNRFLSSIDGPLPGNGDTTTFTYNADGYLASVTNPPSLTTTVTAWDDRGQPASVTDPNGTVTTYAYDARGRLTQIVLNPGTAQSTWTITYDGVGQVTRITQPSGAWLAYTWSGSRRLVKVTNALGEAIDYSYDKLGNLTKTVIRSGDATPVITYQESRVYDELGRQIQRITGTDFGWKTAYDRSDLPVTVTDPRNGVSTMAYDDLARLISITAPDAGVETFALDADDDVTDYTDPRGLATTFTRNGFGEVIQEVSKDRGTTTYHYDAAGRMTKKVDARGVTTNYTYDAGGRPKARTYPGSTGENVAFTYDDTVSGNDGKGRLTKVVDPSGSTSWKVDARGRIISEARVIGSATYTTAFKWDAGNRLVGITYPSGRVVNYEYDSQDRIRRVTTAKSATATAVVVAESLTYKPFGPLAGIQFGNGTVWGRPTNLDYTASAVFHRLQSATADTIRQNLSYDGTNLTAITDVTSSTGSSSYAYDPVNRLSGATQTVGGVSTTYGWTYDKVGNRVKETTAPAGGTTTTRTYDYPATSNRLTSITSPARSFTYDAAGNTLTDVTGTRSRAFTYNDAGRLATVKEDGVLRGTYTYDAFERLAVRVVSTATSSTTTHYVSLLGNGGAFDELMPEAAARMGGLASRFIAEATSAGVTTKEYVWIGDVLAMVIDDVETASPKTWWVATDQINRPVIMTDASKAVVWTATYLPFGNGGVYTGPGSLYARHPGQWSLPESGTYYNWHRAYDQTIGRYTQPDPLGLVDGPSVYGYAQQNPMTWTDPEGLFQDGNSNWRSVCLLVPSLCTGSDDGRARMCSVDGDLGNLVLMGSRRQWTCNASCNVQVIVNGSVCPDRTVGTGTGPNEREACVSAKRSATQSTPSGCYSRHCQCRCSN